MERRTTRVERRTGRSRTADHEGWNGGKAGLERATKLPVLADRQVAVRSVRPVPWAPLGASKRHKPREWPRIGVQPQKICRATLGETSCSFQKFMDDSWEWNDFLCHPSGAKMSRIATGDGAPRAIARRAARDIPLPKYERRTWVRSRERHHANARAAVASSSSSVPVGRTTETPNRGGEQPREW